MDKIINQFATYMNSRIEQEALDMLGASTAINNQPSTLTLGDLNKAMDLLAMPSIPVHSSPYCVAREPVRTHIKKPHMSESYHKRIQKKWNKQFGEKEVPAAYMIDQDAIWKDSGFDWRPREMRGKIIVMHDTLREKLGG